MLAPKEEANAVVEVTQRLVVSFPDVDVADVERVVHQSYEQFTGRPIRDFVPVLVERMARDQLRTTHDRLTGTRAATAHWHDRGTPGI